MAQTATRTEPRLSGPAPALAGVLVAVALAVSPYGLWVGSPSSRSYFTGTLLIAADVGLAIAAVLGAGILVASIRRRALGPGATAWLAVTASLLLAFPWHPSGRGVLTLLHLGSAAVVAAALAQLLRSPWRRTVAVTVCSLGTFESVLAVGQRLVGKPIGLGWIIETPYELYRFGRLPAPDGSFPHPYLLAAFALVTALVAVTVALHPEEPKPVRWAVAAAICVVPVGLTFSRTALLALTLAGGVLAATVFRRDHARSLVKVLAIVALGAGVPAGLSAAGWVNRAATSTTAGATDGRGSKLNDASILLTDHPLTGVGPGRYVFALEQRFGYSSTQQAQQDQAVHNLPLLVGAEGGIAALLAMSLGLGWIGWRALRAGPLALAAYLAFLPFCLLDQLPYESVQGVVICALWLGVVDALVMTRAPVVVGPN